MAYDARRVERVTAKLGRRPRPKQRQGRFGGREGDPADIQDRRVPIKDQFPRGMGSRQSPGQSSLPTTGRYRDDIWYERKRGS